MRRLLKCSWSDSVYCESVARPWLSCSDGRNNRLLLLLLLLSYQRGNVCCTWTGKHLLHIAAEPRFQPLQSCQFRTSPLVMWWSWSIFWLSKFVNDCYSMLFPKVSKIIVQCNNTSLSRNYVAHSYVTVLCDVVGWIWETKLVCLHSLAVYAYEISRRTRTRIFPQIRIRQ